MKKSKRAAEQSGKKEAAGAPFVLRPWHHAAALAGALIAVLLVYAPALRGEFVFDDLYMAIFNPGFAALPFRMVIRSVRPLIALSLWANVRLFGTAPFSYHLVNVAFHFATGLMAYLAARKLLTFAGEPTLRANAFAAFAGALFLLHPVQTESVAYVTGRSETLSVFFVYAALVIFLYRRRETISWLGAAGVCVLFLAAVASKEHAAVLPVALLLTNFYWPSGFSIKAVLRNWRLYLPIALGTVLAVKSILDVLRDTDSAGAAIKSFTWLQYFYTQCRAIWVYIRLFFLPYGQTVDYDFPISRTPFDHAAVIGMAALVGLVIAAFWFRRRWPLASYGFFLFLIFLAPTSSLFPIADPIAERRMYLPMLGLLLVILDFIRRWKAPPRAMAAALSAVLVIFSVIAFNRSQVWSTSLALWEDTAAQSPNKQRPQSQLAFAYYSQGRCADAADRYRIASTLGKPDVRLLSDWAVAYDCLGREEDALAVLRQAAALGPSAHVDSLIAMVYIKQGKRAEALELLNAAARREPYYEATYVYRGLLYLESQQWIAAAADFQRALWLDPTDPRAKAGLEQAQRGMQGQR